MKTYNNGPRKGMMYGGMTRRKPMMYCGMATPKKKKKMQMGGMTQSAPMMPQQKKNMFGVPMMAGGGKAMLGDLNKDGKMSGYEKARQTAINKNMNKNKPKSA
jgi:hypothetical protein